MSNPYQIRTDLLSMAKEMLDKAEQALDAWKRYVPKMYTPDEVKSQAEKLYEFVTEKGDK